MESPIPENAHELDERIAVLSALLTTPGPRSLEYHLARLFQARNQRNDLQRGLQHARRAKSRSDFVPAWLLCSELLVQMQRPEEAISVLKQGIDRIPPDKSLGSLYDSLARLLAELERYDEAISVLKQGMARIPPGKNLVDLYNRCAKILSQEGRYQEAISTLEQGIDRIPPDKALVVLYDRYAQLLSQMGRHREAIDILKQGMVKIPPDKALVVLYDRCARLLSQAEQPEHAIAVLKQGIDRVPPHKGIFPLYYSYGDLLAQQKRYQEAIAVLRQGISYTPVNSSSSLYARCSELLFLTNQYDDAIALLQEGIDRVPPDSGLSLLYSYYAKLLVASGRAAKATEILLDGIRRISANRYLVEFLLLLYTALRDEEGISHFMRQAIEGTRPRYSALAQTLLYQVQEHWNDAATYAGQMRWHGLQYPVLATAEAFSWLCVDQPERALDAISAHLQNERLHNHWLHAFIQLRVGDIDGASQALVAYDGQARSSQDVNEAVLLALWDRPSTTLRQFDLAYYFPTLPPALTGLPHSVTRIPYHPSVLPAYVKSKELLSSRLAEKPESRVDSVKVNGAGGMSENYIDFDLHIASDGHIIASSREGQATGHISTNLSGNIRLTLRLIEQRQTDADLLREVGIALYDWLFPKDIHTHLQQTEAVARRDKAKLRLRLRIESAPIAKLPLEFIYREAGGYFMAVNPDTVLSRYLNLPLPPERVRRREGPLHMLAIIADPTDQVRLDPDEWEAIIKEAAAKPLSDNQMTLHTVKRATRKEIRNALLEQKPDIIQFVGHGIYQGGKGYLALVDEDTGATWTIDDERFANLFMGFVDHLGLIVMATCESAQSDDPQSFLGIAPQLVRRGIPAVVAMQYAVYIKSAKVFLEDFYTAVAARKPMDWAVQSARNAISVEFGLDSREFATPVLYMRAKDGEIF